MLTPFPPQLRSLLENQWSSRKARQTFALFKRQELVLHSFRIFQDWLNHILDAHGLMGWYIFREESAAFGLRDEALIPIWMQDQVMDISRGTLLDQCENRLVVAQVPHRSVLLCGQKEVTTSAQRHKSRPISPIPISYVILQCCHQRLRKIAPEIRRLVVDEERSIIRSQRAPYVLHIALAVVQELDQLWRQSRGVDAIFASGITPCEHETLFKPKDHMMNLFQLG